MLKERSQVKEHAALERFAASRGWVENFVKHHALRSVALHGEAGQVQAGEVSKDIGIDETGLFYKLLPRRTQRMAKLFRPLESLGVGCVVSNALSHLRSAKRAFLEARNEREGRKQQQTLVIVFWTGNGSLN